MTILDRISNAWNALTATGKAAPPSGYGSSYNGGPAWTDAFRSRRAPSLPELTDCYKGIAYACAIINAGAVARVPLRLYVTTASGQARPKSWSCPTVPTSSRVRARTRSAVARATWASTTVAKATEVDEVADHAILDALREANGDFDTNLLLQYTSLCLDIVGSAYWLPDEFKLGVPSLVWPLQAQFVQPVRTSTTLTVDLYRYFGQEYQPDQLVRFRHLSIRDPYGQGYSPLQAAFEQARLVDLWTSVQSSLIDSGLRPSAIIANRDPNVPLGDRERHRLEVEANARLTGANTGRVWVTDRNLDVQPFSVPMADLGSLQISENAVRRFANCFGVPLSLLQTEDVNRANAEAGHYQHATQAVEPRCNLIAGRLTDWLHRLGGEGARAKGWDRLFFAFDDAVPEDQERKAKLFDLALKNYTATVNEVRLELGQEPVPWGDEPLVTGQVRPLSDAIEQAKQPPPSPFGGGPPKGPKPGEEVEDKPGPGEEVDAEAEGESDKKKAAEEVRRSDPFFGMLSTRTRPLTTTKV